MALVGAATTTGTTVLLQSAQERSAEETFDRTVSLVTDAVATETGRYVEALRHLAAAAGALETLTADRFRLLTEPLRSSRLAGASSVVFLVPVAGPEIASVQSLWRQRGAPDLVLRPHTTGHEHLFTIFNEPLDGSPGAAAGVDASQVAAPTEALNEARRTGQVAVSDTYQLILDRNLPPDQRQMSFVLTAPVYGLPGANAGRPFVGWVLMGLRGQDFIGETLRQITQGRADVTLNAVNANGSLSAVAALRSSSTVDRDRQRTVEVGVAQRRWQLRVDSAVPAERPSAAATATAGAGLTVVLAGLVFLLATSRARSDARLVTATADLRRAEADARRDADLLTAVLDSVGDGVGVVDEQGAFLLHNPAARQMLGVPDTRGGSEVWSAHYGLFRADGVTPYPSAELPLARALAGEAVDHEPLVIRNSARPDGIVVTVSARPLNSTAGQVGAVAVFHDITARTIADREIAEATERLREELRRRRIAEAELRSARDDLDAQQAYLHDVLDAIDVGVVTCDTDGVLVHANRFARAGLPALEPPITIVDVSGHVRMAYTDGTPFTEENLPLARALRGERVDGIEAEVIGPDGSRHVLMIYARPLQRDGQLIGAVTSSYAITALREREAELAAFAGVVAHDLKSPLTAINGFTEMVRDSLLERGDAEYAFPLERVLATTGRMHRLIDDLLMYAAARDGALDTAPFDLRALVDEVVTERLAAARTDPTTPTPQIYVGALPTVHADAALIRQLMDNLIGNALKYTPPGQPARIDVTARAAEPGWVRIQVADRGIGIPDGQHAVIFHSFHRAHPTAGYTGTGLGLAICRRVVDRHGGTIVATDNPGGGARFAFTLPLGPRPGPAGGAAPQARRAAGSDAR